MIKTICFTRRATTASSCSLASLAPTKPNHASHQPLTEKKKKMFIFMKYFSRFNFKVSEISENKSVFS